MAGEPFDGGGAGGDGGPRPGSGQAIQDRLAGRRPSLRKLRDLGPIDNRQDAAELASLETDRDISAEDISEENGQFAIDRDRDRGGGIGDRGPRSRPAGALLRRSGDPRSPTESVADRTGLDPGEDFTVEPQPVPDAERRANPDADRTEVVLTDQGEQELTADRVAERGFFRGPTGAKLAAEVVPRPVPDAEQRANPDAGGRDIVLTPAGRSTALIQQVDAQGGFETRDGELVEADPLDLQFTEEGRLSGIDRDSGPGIGDTIAAGGDDLAGIFGGVPDPVAAPVAGFTDATLDVSGDALSATADAPGVTQALSGTRAFGEAVGSASADALEDTNEYIDDIDAEPGTGGRRAGTPGNPPAAKGFLKGLAGLTVGLPAALTGATATAEDAFQATQTNIRDEGVIEGSIGSTGAAVAAGGAAVDRAVRAGKKRPFETGGQLVASGGAGSLVSPVRFSRLDVPKKPPDADTPDLDTPDTEVEAATNLVGRQSGTTTGLNFPRLRSDTITLRGVRLTTPRLLEGRVDRPGTTLYGTVDGRPTLGTPRPDVDDVDFGKLGRPGKGQTAEPTGRFETDVFRALAATDADALDRFTAAEGVVDTATRQGGKLELDATEDIVRQAEDIPDEAAPDVADALADLDATIFGSAAVRAQVPEARAPRDLDIAVDDPDAAKPRLSQALEGTDADVDAFDIKAREERATPGEIVKFGRLAQDRLETDEGVKVTPAGEELLKKAGASAFIRGEGSPAPEFPGRTDVLDVGPEPVSEGSFPRSKDPGDAATVGTAMTDDPGILGTLSPFARRDRARVRTFRDAFETEIERSLAEPGDPPSAGAVPDVGDPLGLRALAADESAQLGGGRGRGSAGVRGGNSDGQDIDSGTDGPNRRVQPRGAERPSPSNTGDFDPAVPTPPPVFGGGASSGGGGSNSPLGSAPSPTGAESPEIGGVESPSPGVNPGGSVSKSPSQIADESPSLSPPPSDADSAPPGFGPESPSPGVGSESPPSSPPSDTPTPSSSPGPTPTTAPSPNPPPPPPSDTSTPPPPPPPSPSTSPNPPPPPLPNTSPLPDVPPPTPGPGPPTQPRLDDPTDDDPEEELLFVSGAVDERFINPIERLGDADAGPDIEGPPEFDGPEYGGP
jgi:hypothetical protein